MNVSVVIPSRSPQYLQRTIDDLLSHAESEVEVIVVLDGIWVDPPLKDDKRVIIIHQGTIHGNRGMRAAINAGMRVAKGKYVAKSDEHCSFSQGWDVKLAADCADNEMIIPRRGRLDADAWRKIEDGRADVDYMYIEYPYAKLYDKTQGLHGAIWKREGRDHLMLDETPTSQGSFHFMSRKHWDRTIKEMDAEHYGQFTAEAQELTCATWLSGGRVMVNKNVTYLHMHKGNNGKGYGFSNAMYREHQRSMEMGRLYTIDHWLNTKEYKYDWEWFINKFPDMPGWSKDWKKDLERDSALEKRYRETGVIP